jgi:hypothetical protein
VKNSDMCVIHIIISFTIHTLINRFFLPIHLSIFDISWRIIELNMPSGDFNGRTSLQDEIQIQRNGRKESFKYHNCKDKWERSNLTPWWSILEKSFNHDTDWNSGWFRGIYILWNE